MRCKLHKSDVAEILLTALNAKKLEEERKESKALSIASWLSVPGIMVSHY